MGATADNAHGRKGQTCQTRIHGGAGQPLCGVNHIVTDSTSITEGCQSFPDLQTYALLALGGKRTVHGNHFFHTGQFCDGNGFCIIHHIRNGNCFKIKGMLLFRRLCLLRLKENGIIFCNKNDIRMEVLNAANADPFACPDFRKDINALLCFIGFDIHGNLQCLCLGNMCGCNIFQHLQTKRPIAAQGTQCRRHIAAKLLRAGNGAGKGVFIHAAIHHHANLLQLTAHSRIGSRRRKGNRADLCYA